MTRVQVCMDKVQGRTRASHELVGKAVAKAMGEWLPLRQFANDFEANPAAARLFAAMQLFQLALFPLANETYFGVRSGESGPASDAEFDVFGAIWERGTRLELAKYFGHSPSLSDGLNGMIDFRQSFDLFVGGDDELVVQPARICDDLDASNWAKVLGPQNGKGRPGSLARMLRNSSIVSGSAVNKVYCNNVPLLFTPDSQEFVAKIVSGQV